MSYTYVDTDEYVDKMLERECDRELLVFRALQMDYPDLKLATDSLGPIRYVSRQASPYCDKIEHRYGPNRELQVWIYLEDKSARVYADPAVYVVGHRIHGYLGVVPAPGWEERMEADGYGKDIIRQVKNLLNSQKPAQYY